MTSKPTLLTWSRISNWTRSTHTQRNVVGVEKFVVLLGEELAESVEVGVYLREPRALDALALVFEVAHHVVQVARLPLGFLRLQLLHENRVDGFNGPELERLVFPGQNHRFEEPEILFGKGALDVLEALLFLEDEPKHSCEPAFRAQESVFGPVLRG